MPRGSLPALHEVCYLINKLVGVLGWKLVAYISKAEDLSKVQNWISGIDRPAPEQWDILLATHRVVTMLTSEDDSTVVRAWMLGKNPFLNDQNPATLLRNGQDDEVVRAARSLAVNG